MKSKKKIATIALVAVLAAVSVAALTACSPDYVNISGNYTQSTAAEVSSFLEESNAQPYGAYNFYYLAESRAGDAKLKMELDGIMELSDAGVKMSVDYDMEISAAGTSTAAEMSVYSDGEYIYIVNGDSKYKTPVSGSESSGGVGTDTAVGVPSVPYEDIVELLQGSDVECYVSESGSETKIKIIVNLTNLGLDESMFSADIPVEYYIVIDDGRLTGIAAKCDGNVVSNGTNVNVKVDIQLGATDKSVSLPSDLGSYAEI